MLVNFDSTGWGPQFLIPTVSINKYCGHVVLRETLDDDLLKKELMALRISGHPVGYNNAWYIRKKGIGTWMKVGESTDRSRDFAVCLDSKELRNGIYQVLGFMSIKVKTGHRDVIISRQNIADLKVKN